MRRIPNDIEAVFISNRNMALMFIDLEGEWAHLGSGVTFNNGGGDSVDAQSSGSKAAGLPSHS